MISNFFVLSPRGDTILAKQYRTDSRRQADGAVLEMAAHERSHTEAFFRKIKFWDDATSQAADSQTLDHSSIQASAPPLSATTGTATSLATNTTGTDAADGGNKATSRTKGDAPPVFVMPDGLTYFHLKRNGLVFAASSARNVSPNTVLEVSVCMCVYSPWDWISFALG